MPKFIEVRVILGISEAQANEVYYDVVKTLEKTKRLGEGIKVLTERYDPKAMLAGMAIRTVLEMNKETQERRRAKGIQKAFQQQDAPLN